LITRLVIAEEGMKESLHS